MDRGLLIRKVNRKDFSALRKLTADTAYFGEECENFFPDRELLADLIMNYYMIYEPCHTWVAEHKGEVVGYLSAGLDETKYGLYMITKVLPVSVIKALIRGKIWSKKSLRLIKYNLLSFLRRETSLKKIKGKYTAHIHQNIKTGFRGRKIGSRLVEEFLRYIKGKNIGVKFRALRQEDRFCFFEKYGFKLIDRRRVPTWEKWLGKSPLYYMEYTREPE